MRSNGRDRVGNLKWCGKAVEAEAVSGCNLCVSAALISLKHNPHPPIIQSVPLT